MHDQKMPATATQTAEDHDNTNASDDFMGDFNSENYSKKDKELLQKLHCPPYPVIIVDFY